MKVEVVYDKETEAKIRTFEKVLEQFDETWWKVRHKKITANRTCSADILDLFYGNPDRQAITAEIVKIRKLSIPVSILLVPEEGDVITKYLK